MPDNYQSTMLYVWVNVLCLIVLAVIFVGIIRYGTRNKRSSFANNGLFDFRSQHIRFVVGAYERRGYKG